MQLYRLLGVRPLNRNPEGGRLLSRTRSVIFLSATHLATVQFHLMWKLPFKFIGCTPQELSVKGYTMFRDLKPYMIGGQEKYLSV